LTGAADEIEIINPDLITVEIMGMNHSLSTHYWKSVTGWGCRFRSSDPDSAPATGSPFGDFGTSHPHHGRGPPSPRSHQRAQRPGERGERDDALRARHAGPRAR
jgi:hypothetical protein